MDALTLIQAGKRRANLSAPLVQLECAAKIVLKQESIGIERAFIYSLREAGFPYSAVRFDHCRRESVNLLFVLACDLGSSAEAELNVLSRCVIARMEE